MLKIPLGKCKKQVQIQNFIKKVTKISTRNNFVVVFISSFRGNNPNVTWGTTGGGVCISSDICFAKYKEEPGAAGSTFDGEWGTRWWRDVDGGAENKEWAVSVGEDGNVGVHGDVTGDKSGSGRIDCGWNFSWDECGVSDEEGREVGEVMSLVG